MRNTKDQNNNVEMDEYTYKDKNSWDLNRLHHPQVSERALMIDIGRKFYSKNWLKKLIEKMSSLKLNTLQLHFSENEGFRIESEIHPEFVSKEYLTKNDVREIIDYAKKYEISIIPDIDTPGHLETILKYYPEYQVSKIENNKKILDPRALDITNKSARNFIKEILKEYMELFKDSKYFHIGADEFIDFNNFNNYPKIVHYAKNKYGENATGIDAYIDYVNDIAQFVEDNNFITRAWNDGFYRLNQNPIAKLKTSIEITYWTKWEKNMAPVKIFIDKGHKIINFSDNYFYYVLGENAGYKYPDGEKILSDWDISVFSENQKIQGDYVNKIIGASFAIWSDVADAQSEDEVMNMIDKPLRAMALKC